MNCILKNNFAPVTVTVVDKNGEIIIIKRMDAQYGDAHNLEMDFTISQKKIKKSFKMFNWLIILMFY